MSVHGVWQQIDTTQAPLWHWLFSLHVIPSASGAQAAPSHVEPSGGMASTPASEPESIDPASPASEAESGLWAS